MKTKLLPALALFLAGAAALVAAPLTATTAVHTKPDASSPVISYLKAGTEPKAAAGTLTSLVLRPAIRACSRASASCSSCT